MNSCVYMCVCVCSCACMHTCVMVHEWKSGEQWDQFSPSHHTGLSGELRLLGLLAGAFLRTIGQPQIHVFKMCDFLYWSIGD